MKVQIEEISPIKKKLLIEVPHDDYQKALDKAFHKLAQKTQIKGFRKGKVPRSILEKYYGEKTNFEALNEVVDEAYRQAIQSHALWVIAMPKITDLKADPNQPISFTAEVEVQPQVEAKDFEEIPLEKNNTDATDAELSSELLALQKQYAQRVPLAPEQAAQKGHIAVIAYTGFMDGSPIKDAVGENVEIALGAGRILKDFEDAILGMKKGEEKEVSIHYPADYEQQDLRGKEAKYQIRLSEVKEEILPALDDEFAKDLGPHQRLDEVKEDLKQQIKRAKDLRERGHLFKQIVDHLVSKNIFEIPDAMIERELDYMVKTTKDQLSHQGMRFEQLGVGEQEYRGKNREEAIRRIKGFLLFDSIALQHKIKIQETDVEEKMAQIAQSYQQPVETVKKYYQKQDMMRSLQDQILEEKTLDFLIAKAKITERAC